MSRVYLPGLSDKISAAARPTARSSPGAPGGTVDGAEVPNPDPDTEVSDA